MSLEEACVILLRETQGLMADACTGYKYLLYSLNWGRESRAQGQRQGKGFFF